MQQASDFLEESEVLAAALDGLSAGDWNRATLFKGWTINDVMVHLHFWNRAADLSVMDPPGFDAFWTEIAGQMDGGLRPLENAMIPERGAELKAMWQEKYRAMGRTWEALDPRMRVKWAGPDMSVRSSITARQMETWAHGLEVFDLLGIERAEADRIRNIVVLGVNTYGWTFMVRGRDAPGPMPQLQLTAPSGAVWEYGEADGANSITGSAVEFAQVVTQTRNIADTGLRVEGAVATEWMENAQCFAGPPETPPGKGVRHRAV